jgi:hypothetical protein
MSAIIYEKSDKGREEIATRRYQLPSRLRTLLVTIDGIHSADALLKNVAGLGLGEQSIQFLLDQQFIVAPVEVTKTITKTVTKTAPNRD